MATGLSKEELLAKWQRRELTTEELEEALVLLLGYTRDEARIVATRAFDPKSDNGEDVIA